MSATNVSAGAIGRRRRVKQPIGASAHDGKSPHIFRALAVRSSNAFGTPWAFALAVTTIVVWAALGPLFHFSDTWQLVINTGTTIVTFLMVFLIQYTQNREAAALRVKVDELIRALDGARNSIIDVEELDDEALARIQEDLQRIARQGRRSKAP